LSGIVEKALQVRQKLPRAKRDTAVVLLSCNAYLDCHNE